jgi:hypothetical protein
MHGHAVRGLAWDDRPEDYMLALQRRLEPLEIGLEVHDDHGKFLAEFEQNDYDFVVLDLFKDKGANYQDVGRTLADSVAHAVSSKPWYPIFIVTEHLDRMLPEHHQNLPSSAFLRYKADPVFVAKLIKEDLVRRGVFTSRNKVFLIRSTAQPAAESVKHWLALPSQQR